MHPTGKAIARFGTKSQGQGHETTYAQIVAEELGIPADAYRRSKRATPTPRPTASAPMPAARRRWRARPRRWPARKIRDKARKIAAHLLEAREEDLEWEPGKFSVKGAPQTCEDDPGDRVRRLHESPAGHGGRARGGQLLRSAEPHVSVRQLHLRGGHRPGHGRGEDPPLRRGRRLRQHHQSDDRRGADPRRPHDGARRRRCSRRSATTRAATSSGGSFMDYLRADRDGDAEVGDWQDRHARRRTIRSAPRASASRRPSARRRRSPTRWWTRSGISACRHIDIPITPAKVWPSLEEGGARNNSGSTPDVFRFHFGGRFSTKARTPSLKSALP